MSVTIRPYRGGGWEVDIRVVSPDGTRHKRERKHAPISSRTAVGRWAAARERVLFERLLSPPKDHPRKEVPTLQEFAPRFVDGHARANRQKPSGIASKTMILRLYLIPGFGRRRRSVRYSWTGWSSVRGWMPRMTWSTPAVSVTYRR